MADPLVHALELRLSYGGLQADPVVPVVAEVAENEGGLLLGADAALDTLFGQEVLLVGIVLFCGLGFLE